ncbi:MAG: GIY-YIG nuclease family protein [Candidatus Buchananbacteria bacterium]|jgi:putative endonuclease
MRKDHLSFVYILSNSRNGTLYIGVTSDLIKRMWQHKNKEFKGFTNIYNIDKLVYFEEHFTIIEAINREKKIKKWHRQWKIQLIEKNNPNWDDLYIRMIE